MQRKRDGDGDEVSFDSTIASPSFGISIFLRAFKLKQEKKKRGHSPSSINRLPSVLDLYVRTQTEKNNERTNERGELPTMS